jgi:hypothetical protein
MNSDGETIASYPYRGVPPTPQIVAHLTKELFAGKLAERQTIVEEVQKLHTNRGGLPPKVSDFASTVKKALANMQRAGEAENPSLGYWKILPKNTEVIPDYAVGEAAGEENEQQINTPDESRAEVMLGSGAGSVYLYYLPMYRARAEERGEDRWPCKIGRTEQNPLQSFIPSGNGFA